MKRRIWPLLLAATSGFAVLMALGIWQVQRSAWKNALVAEIDQRLAEKPVAISDLRNRPIASDGTLVKVKAIGHFKPKQLRKISVLNGGAGWEILQGFEFASGGDILISRGVASQPVDQAYPEQDIEVIGLLRRHGQDRKQQRGFFDPDNNPVANQWYWWDVPAMREAADLRFVTHTSIVLHLLPGSPGAEGLHVDPPKANLRNNHLGYAITWFGLAAALLAVTGAYILQQAKNTRHSRRARNEVE